jgi:prevent-host-death family protein
MTTVKAREAKSHFSKLLNRVARGERFTIIRYGAPVAMLVPVEEKVSKLTHREIVEGMRELRKRVRPRKMGVREMVAEGRRN